MTVELEDTGTRIHQSRIRLRYNWWVGSAMGRFYSGIKEKRKIWGDKCPACGLIYVPPKENCPKCFARMNEFIELEDTGSLLTYTVVRYLVASIQPQEPPYILGIIKLDGADTGLTHLVGGVHLDEVEVGMRLRAVFRDDPQGNLMDIKYFRPI